MAVNPVSSAISNVSTNLNANRNANVLHDVGGEVALNAFHQFRLRHLTSIHGVNFKRPSGNGAEEDGRVDADDVNDDRGVFFLTLHDPNPPPVPSSKIEHSPDRPNRRPSVEVHDEDEPVLYRTSPKAGPSPVWRLCDLKDSVREELLACEDVVVKIWLVENPLNLSGRVICSYLVNLRSLAPVDAVLSRLGGEPAKEIGTMRTAFVENSLCFAFGKNDGTLFVPPCCSEKRYSCAEEEGREEEECCWRKWTSADCGEVLKSYSVASASRLRSLGRAVREMREDRADFLVELEKISGEGGEERRLVEEIEAVGLRVSILKEAKERLLASLRTKRQRKNSLEERNSDAGWLLMSRYQDLNRDRERMRELGLPAWGETRDNLLSTQVQLGLRRRELLSQLATVYPLNKGADKHWTICGIHLPDGENYAGHDDTRIAVAFGFVTRLCELISFIVNVPLKYPTDFRGSRSSVFNHASAAAGGVVDQAFHLFDRKANKQRFEYAAYLINVNVAHLRSLCGMATPDLRQTLANLATLVNDVTPKKIPLRLGGDARDGASSPFPPPPPYCPQTDSDSKEENEPESHHLKSHLNGPWKRLPMGGSQPNMLAYLAAKTTEQHQQQQRRARGLMSLGVNLLPPPAPPLSNSSRFHPSGTKKSHARSVSLEERRCRAMIRPAGDVLGVECGTEVTENGGVEDERRQSESCDKPGCDIEVGERVKEEKAVGMSGVNDSLGQIFR